MRRFVLVFVVYGAAAATVLAGSSFAGVQSPKTVGASTDVTVVLRSYSIAISTNTVPAGTVTFKVINDGQSPHNFSIAGQKTRNLGSGEDTTLAVNLTQGGAYTYRCTISNHAFLGMKGTLTVTGGTRPAPKPTAILNVSESEWKIKLTKSPGVKVKSVKHGLIRFKVTNVGRRPHNFAIGKNHTRVLGRGQQAVLNVVLKRGTYRYACSVKGHAARGMRGVLRVT